MAGCSGAQSYLVLRVILKVPQELMGLGPVGRATPSWKRLVSMWSSGCCLMFYTIPTIGY